jgi:phosphoribosylformimino-5-aminoimidazole carboxamide ribotide isomerase
VELFPAVDIHHGTAVRLTRGDFSEETDYGDPLELARSFAAAGAGWIHVVDLDAARSGTPVHRDLILAIVDEVDAQIQVGGGLRTEHDATALLDGGAARVVLGTAAVGDPGLVADLSARYPGRIAVGLDHRDGGASVAVAGWEEDTGRSLPDVLATFESTPLAAVVVTAIDRDGTMTGPDLRGLTDVLGWTAHDVVASGGVRSVDDLRALGALRGTNGRQLAGVVVGRALVDGALDVEEAITACATSG